MSFLKPKPFEMDQFVLELGGRGDIGKIFDIQPKSCLVKFPGSKARWILKSRLVHYTTGE